MKRVDPTDPKLPCGCYLGQTEHSCQRPLLLEPIDTAHVRRRVAEGAFGTDDELMDVRGEVLQLVPALLDLIDELRGRHASVVYADADGRHWQLMRRVES